MARQKRRKQQRRQDQEQRRGTEEERATTAVRHAQATKDPMMLPQRTQQKQGLVQPLHALRPQTIPLLRSQHRLLFQQQMSTSLPCSILRTQRCWRRM